MINVVKDLIQRHGLKNTFKLYTMELSSIVGIRIVKIVLGLDSQDTETHQTDPLMKENIMEHHIPSTKRVLFFKLHYLKFTFFVTIHMLHMYYFAYIK